MALGCLAADAQVEGSFEYGVAVRTSPGSDQPVRLLGIEPIDSAGTRFARQESLPPVSQPGETRLLSADDRPGADDRPDIGAIAPGPFDEFYDDRFDRPLSFRDDLHDCLSVLRDDAIGVVNWNNAAILGTALAAAIGIRQDLDDQVRRNTARHPERWGDLSKTLGRLGEPQYHLPIWLGVYAYGLHEQDEKLHAMTGSLLSAYTISGLTTITIKAIANTDRPSDDWNDGQFGFPSFHTSAGFAVASVLDEYYGPKAGLPAYALAGLIGWSRIDERDHDLSDVVFGAALGFVIGKSVARRHLYGDSRVRLRPYTHPTEGATGLMLDIAY